jgi:hypothetical protein
VTTIGHCATCQKMAVLEVFQCSACASLFGKNGGRVSRKIRNDPEFKAMIFGRIKSDQARARFVEMFGAVEVRGLRLV